MSWEAILSDRRMSIYRLAQASGLSYATVHDIVSGKTSMAHSQAGIVRRLAQAVSMPMEELMAACEAPSRPAFELFKSAVCHELKRKGDLDFVIDALQQDAVTTYWNQNRKPEALYMLALLDYLCRVNGLERCNRYDPMRIYALKEPLYPRDIALAARLNPDGDARERAMREAIPEFLHFNIVERDVRNVQ